MDGWPKVRAMLSVAVAWAIPWALVGGTLSLTFAVLTAPDNVPVIKYMTGGWRSFLIGAFFGAPLGAIAGATFAALLSARTRARDIMSLRTADASRLGALSGAAAVVPCMLLMSWGSARSPFLLTPVMLLASAAGALSAYALVALARRRSPADASLRESVESPSEVLAAQSELELMLSARDNLTKVGADGRLG